MSSAPRCLWMLETIPVPDLIFHISKSMEILAVVNSNLCANRVEEKLAEL